MLKWLLVGLGNPGRHYHKTRHNTGFMVLDKIRGKNGFPEFRLHKKSNCLVSEGVWGDQKIILAKPQTFMNNSGGAVTSLSKRYKIQDTRYIIVVHDDIDIPLGKIKVSVGRGSAGHKGAESVIKALGTKDFTRIRIGIRPARGKPKDTENFVLESFTQKELSLLALAVAQVIPKVHCVIPGTKHSAVV